MSSASPSSAVFGVVTANWSSTGVVEAVEWLRTRVMWNKEARPPTMR